MNELPNALVIGPMKSGTSWIQNYLVSRDDVVLPQGVKETFFFERNFDKGVDWYRQHFKNSDANTRRRIEVGPSYFHSRVAPENVYSLLPSVPLIITLRDPVRRAWSHYLHLRRYGFIKGTLQEAVKEYPEILEASRYKTCLERWLSVFSPQQFSILWQGTLAESPSRYASELCKALAIPDQEPGKHLFGKSNAAAVPASYRLARFGSRISSILRERRLYSAINLAKRMGLKSVFYGRPGKGSVPELSSRDASWLESELSGEMPSGLL